MLRLIGRAQECAERTAVVSGGADYRYEDLLAASHRLASVLLDGRDDLAEAPVAFMVSPGFDYVRAQWAIWRSGGIAVPLCLSHPLPALRYVLGDTNSRTLIVSPEHEAVLAELAGECGVRIVVLSQEPAALPGPLPGIDSQRRAMILYTSGTTSKPKGVVITHANLEAQITALVEAWGWRGDDRTLCTLPLHHIHGIVNVVSCALWAGACCEFLPGFSSEGVFAAFERGRVNVFMAVPTIYHKLIAAWALAVVCLGNIGIAYSSSYGHLLFWKILAGFGTGTSFVAGARYLAQTIPPEGLARAQGYYGGSVLLGSGFVIYAVPRVAELAGWRGAFWTTATVAVVVLLVWVLVAPAPQPKRHPHVALSALLAHPQLWLLGLVQMASFALVILIGSWITLLLRNQFGLTPTGAGALGSLVLLLGIVTRPLGGRLVTWAGVRPLLAASLIVNTAGCLLLAGARSSPGAAVVAIFLLGVGCGLPYAVLFNRAAAMFPGRAGAAMGLVNMLGIVMILVGAPAVGKIADWTGSFQASFVALAAFNAVVLMSVGFIRRDQPGSAG